MSGDWFVALLVCVESAASLTYLFAERDWRQAIVWGGVAISNAAYLSLVRRI